MIRTGEIGDLVLELHEDVAAASDEQRYKVRIVHADPRVLISAEDLEQIRRYPSHVAHLAGDILKITATNRTVIYRIGEKVPNMLAYVAEWPD